MLLRQEEGLHRTQYEETMGKNGGVWIPGKMIVLEEMATLRAKRCFYIRVRMHPREFAPREVILQLFRAGIDVHLKVVLFMEPRGWLARY